MRCISWFILFVPIFLFGQNIALTIKDYDTKALIPNAKLVSQNKLIGLADSKGVAMVPRELKIVEVSAMSYDTTEVILGSENQLVYLYRKEKKIKEVIIKPKIDEYAHQLIRRMIDRFDINHPHQLPSYQLMVYSKFVADAREDSVMKYKDVKDSIENKELLDFAKHSKLFVWEKASIFKYDKRYGDKKVLLSSKMSGFKQPIYEVLALSLDDINIIPRIFKDERYKEYYFRLEDSFMLNGRKTYAIAFFPIKKYKTKRSRHGYVHIDSMTKAFVKYQGHTQEGFAEITNQFVQEKCFTKEINYYLSDVFFKINNFKSITTYRLRVDQIETLKEFKSNEFRGNTNDISATLNDKKSLEVLSQLRGADTLDLREANTYNSLDSIIARDNIQTKLKLLLALRKGYMKFGKVNLSILDFLQYNRYEGLRIQAGGQTGYEFNPKIGINGYIAYGLSDKNLKGGIGISYLLDYYRQSKLALNYQNDVLPAGRNAFDLYNSMDRFNHLLNVWFIDKYFHTQNVKLSFQSDVSKHLEQKIYIQYADISTRFPYQFDGVQFENVSMASTGLFLRYYPKSEFITTPEGKFSVNEKPTQFQFHYSYHYPVNKTITSFHTINIEAKTKIKSKIGTADILINSGITLGNAPIISLYEGLGSSNTSSDLYKSFGLGSYRYFETMEPTSFYSDKFASLFIKYHFPSIRTSVEKRIYLSAVYKVLWGDLSNTSLHSIALQSPHKLYQETGVEWDNILGKLPLGLGIYYRIGAYHTGNFGNNIAGRFLIKL